MKRSFAEYVLYFKDDRTPFGDFAREITADLFFPNKEADASKIYHYLDKNKIYDKHKGALIELYRRYLKFMQ